MAMRRAAFAPENAEDSAKLRRLPDITDEATQDRRKAVVFSFFRERSDFPRWADVGLGRGPGSGLLRAASPVAHRAEELDLHSRPAVPADPAPLDLTTALHVSPQAKRPKPVNDRLVVVGCLSVKQVKRQVKVEVGRSDVRA